MKRIIGILLLLTFIYPSCVPEENIYRVNPPAPTIMVVEATRTSVQLLGVVPRALDDIEGGFRITASGSGEKSHVVRYYSVGPIPGTNSFYYTCPVSQDTNYVVESYITNGISIKYSEQLKLEIPKTSPATLSPVSIMDGVLSATILDDGGRIIKEVGFIGGTSPSLDEIRHQERKKVGVGSFSIGDIISIPLDRFAPRPKGEKYYFVAYAYDNEGATGYSTKPLECEHSIDDAVSFEDPAFEIALIKLFDKDNDKRISYAEIGAITQLNIPDAKISSIAEIRLMPKLKQLDCRNNQIERLDFSEDSNSGLQVLNVSGNPLREFSPALCPYLKELKLNACQVKQLDISKNIYLTSLECSGNQLAELHLSDNQFLQVLDCSANKMKSLDVSPVRWLQSLNASDNPLQTLYLYATQKIEKPNVPPETRWVYLINSLSLNQETLHLPIGASFQLQPTILPEDTIDKTVEWLSSDYEVATVTSEGLVSGISVGDCTITAFCGGKEATITVHIIEVPISSVELKPGILEMNEGDTFQLQATVLPENATEKTVLWESSDPDIASVDEGEITAHKSGIAIITARAGDASANCTVTVSKSIIPVASITLSETSLSLVEGESATLVATVLPEDATERTVEWTSSDERVATVSDGFITANQEGVAQIVATAGDKSASCTVTVSKGFVPVFSISLNEKDLEMIEGDTFTLVATILPEDATDKTVAWWTSNPQVAVVTGGEVTALQEGSATIIATAGDESATCAVTVSKRYILVTSLTLNEMDVQLFEGDTFTLIATISPEDATDKTVIWSSSNPQVVSVDNGEIMALQEGFAAIIATAGEASATCFITVKKKEVEVHPEFVDLGLSVMWATFNVGATSPEEYGDYFAWGETEPYYEAGYARSSNPVWKFGKESGYYWTSYKWCNGSSYTLTKYCPSDQNSYWGGIGSPDGKIDFSDYDFLDDAARANWGGNTRLPTEAEWAELQNSCSWLWTNVNGVNGFLVTSRTPGYTSNSIFLPAAGYRISTSLFGVGEHGLYWSSTLNTDNPDDAYNVSVNAFNYNWGINNRCGGFTVRPVYQVFIPVIFVSLEPRSLELKVGESHTLLVTINPSNATDKNILWSTSNESVATVNAKGFVSAVGSGTATIIAYASSGASASCTITVITQESETILNGHEYADLGLPSGLKWAPMNVGATSPEEYGDYFAWGETGPYYEAGYAPSSNPVWKSGKESGYDWPSYKWCNGGYDKLTKYCTNTDYWDGSGPMDNKSVLDLEDDAAHVNWGGSWRMPTLGEWQELIDNCTWMWTTQNGVNGRMVIGPNGNNIFLPAAGNRLYTNLMGAGYNGDYWSSTLDSGGSTCIVMFYAVNYYWASNSGRSDGFTVRPVTE